MHAIRVASAALLGVGALALSAPAILASDSGDGGRDGTPFGFRVTPTTVTAGGRVSLHLDRGSGCRGAATVTSGVFDTVRIPSERDSVTATVDRDAKSQASYRVTFNCDGSSATTELAIASGASAGHGDTDGNGHADDQSGGNDGGRTDGRTDSGTGEHSAGRTETPTDSRTDAGTDGRTDDGSGSGESLNPQPIPPGRGVQAGEGGSIGGFDVREIGLGAALVVGSVGTAYRLSRRRAGEDGA
ncbi:MSCRAMM family adhesin SdrC [Streptomyces sp. GbtcB6]|uniref:MSCRAMM family adhesin SdrC n=1 Tax=Streptomyces sp. GbtcB6 TaxID=2824751 RepID=UPI001C30FCA9|nr:MSCRAMM family adhesin SdrC [Streptomyces sp. GbtcB6]